MGIKIGPTVRNLLSGGAFCQANASGGIQKRFAAGACHKEGKSSKEHTNNKHSQPKGEWLRRLGYFGSHFVQGVFFPCIHRDR